jgi:DNA invertase Pin-like site-specific DNA recombinase
LTYLKEQVLYAASAQESGSLADLAELVDAELAESRSVRVKKGIAEARKRGSPWGRKKVSEDIEAKIRARRSDGLGMGKIARELGIGVSVVQRVVKEDGY